MAQRHYTIPIFIPHLGCPYDCIYCDQKIIANRTEAPAAHQIEATIEQYLSTMARDAWIEVGFFGGSFTAIDMAAQEAYLQQVQPFRNSGRINGIRVSTRPDCIDGSKLDLLARYGVGMIELGVQSMDEGVLTASGRCYGPGDVKASCDLIKDRHFKLGIQLMIGLPGDSYASDMATAEEVIKIRPQAVRIYPTLILAGTKLASMYSKGLYTPLQLEEAVRICKDMFLQFYRYTIPVIRMGLYPGEELRQPGVTVAGPFHSSFGELVEQLLFREQAHWAIRSFWNNFGCWRKLCLYVHERDISKMVGHRRSNCMSLQQDLELETIEVKGSRDQPQDSIGVGDQSGDGPQLLLTREEYLNTLPL